MQYRPKKRISATGVILLILVALAILYPFAEAMMPRVADESVVLTGLPATAKNLKLVFLSDIHQDTWMTQPRVDSLIDKVNSLEPDLVLLGGDYATDCVTAAEFFKTSRPIRARLGVYCVLGETDLNGTDVQLQRLVNAISAKGYSLLRDAASQVRVGGAVLYVAGIEKDAAKVAVNMTQDDTVILLSHNPGIIPKLFELKGRDGNSHWFDLALFGHTHGGQINLFGWTPFLSQEDLPGKQYVSGWSEQNRAYFLVTNGIGTKGLPLRLAAPPQLHLITLK